MSGPRQESQRRQGLRDCHMQELTRAHLHTPASFSVLPAWGRLGAGGRRGAFLPNPSSSSTGRPGSHALPWSGTKASQADRRADPRLPPRDPVGSAIEGGSSEWDCNLQMFSEEECTQQWSFRRPSTRRSSVPRGLCRLRNRWGGWCSNPNPDNFFAEPKQIAFPATQPTSVPGSTSPTSHCCSAPEFLYHARS